MKKFFGSRAWVLLSIASLFFISSPALARIDYHGYYFVENDTYNIHFMPELVGSTNTVGISFDQTLSNFQTLADNIRKNKNVGVEMTLGITEPIFTNAGGARDIYLQNVRKKLFQDSDMGKMVINFHILEEEYTLLKQGYFDGWSIFQNVDVSACQTKYGDKTLNARDCEQRMMKEGLESYISDIHKYFPGIPVAIVENRWGYDFVPPNNLDILGIDAYYIPTSTACDATQKGWFDREVTNVVQTAAQYGKPIQIVGGVFSDASTYKMPSQCQAQWYLDLAKSTPLVTSFNWFLYADVDYVKGVRNDTSGLINFLKSEGSKIVTEASKPTITAATISSKSIIPNGSSTYDITVTTNDINGSDDIKVQYALVNQLYQGPNGGQYRGYVGWSKDSDSVQKYYFPGISGATIACTGGGTANKAIGYGDAYINLLSCASSTSGNSRTTTFTVSFNNSFTTPTTNNTVSAWSSDAEANRTGWVTFDSFGLLPNRNPVINNATISSQSVKRNPNTTYDIAVTTSDPDGVDDVKVQYALVNQLNQGINGGQYRGYIGWSKDGDSVQKYYFPGISGPTLNCNGGGTANKATGYGEEYMNLISCSTSTSGNSRTTIFTVSFNPNFTAPVNNNTVSAWSADGSVARSGWQTFQTFSLSGNSAPAIINTSINSSSVVANGSNNYSISVTTADPDGSDDVKVQYANINVYQGLNAGQSRGYIGWSKDGDSVQKYYFPGISGDTIACTGGGTANKAIGYGEEYINLLGCSTSTSGNSRTTTFSVSFNPNFTSPTTSNTISGWSADAALVRSGWQTFQTFSLK